MSDERKSVQAGEASAGKEDAQQLSEHVVLKARRARLLRKIREQNRELENAPSTKQVEPATAGDDFCAEVLSRFGIEI